MRLFFCGLVCLLPLVSCQADNIGLPPTNILRCNVMGGASPPRGDYEGAYTATYYFVSGEIATCAAAQAAADMFFLTVDEGVQNYSLKSGADPQLEASYVPNPYARLTDKYGTHGYIHEFIDGYPGYINTHGARCLAERVSAINTPTGANAAELLLKITSCDSGFFTRTK